MSTSDNFSVAQFVYSHQVLARGRAIWGNGALPLDVCAFLGDEFPPTELITSVRSLVFHQDSILVLRNEGGTHIIPGGRREAGESYEATVRREILEEAGWHIQQPSLLGFMHLHHLAPKPEKYSYPHPDFFWAIHMAEADRAEPGAKVDGDYERESGFVPLSEAVKIELSPYQKAFLNEALAIRRKRGLA